jgi:predicted GNAT superfamily acetyltransferase
MTASRPSITVRPCVVIDEINRCVELQREIWGFERNDLAPAIIFVVAAKTGGHVLGAFDGDKQVGFALAFAAFRPDRCYLHSHMVGVLSTYQNLGIGRQIKLKQRAIALDQNIGLIEWTFDPLELRNAYFNIARLGAIVRQYIPNAYGLTSSALHGNLPTDRFVAEWELAESRRNECRKDRASSDKEIVSLSIPEDISEIKHQDPAKAAHIQAVFRSDVSALFSIGYVITGFRFEAGNGIYLLEKYED